MNQTMFQVASRPWDAPEWDILHEEPVTQEEGVFIIDVAAGLTIHLEYTLLPIGCTGHWEIQMLTVCDGWVNTWHEDEKLVEFDTFAEASEELLVFLQDMRQAERDGRIMCAPNEADYRITFIPNEEK